MVGWPPVEIGAGGGGVLTVTVASAGLEGATVAVMTEAAALLPIAG